MRFLLLALCAIQAHAERWSSSEIYQEYNYRYDAQLVTGSPQSSELTSGLRLIGDFQMYLQQRHHHPADTFLVKLKNVNVEKMDRFLEGKTAMFNLQLEDALLDGIEAEVHQDMILQLQRPFKFRWQKGQVMDMVFEGKDPQWSMNIKQGLLSMFIVNLDQTYSPRRPPQDEQQKDRFNAFQGPYSVWEDSPVGYCLTTYTPVPAGKSDQFYLTKVRHYDTCLSRSPMAYVFDNFGPKQPPQTGMSSVNHLNMQGTVSYSIEGNKKQFLIMSAIGQGKIVFTPYGPQDGGIQTSINQTLTLTDARKDSKNSQESEDWERKLRSSYKPALSVKMLIPLQSSNDRYPYVINTTNYNPESLWSVQKMKQLVEWVANGTNGFPSEEVLMTQQTLMEMIRQSDNHTLSDLMSRLKNPRDSDDQLAYLKLKTLWVLLSMAGTTSASQVIVDRCIKVAKEQDHKAPSCLPAITSLGLYTPPSELIMSKLVALLSACEEHHHTSLKEVTMLALGSIMGRAEDMVTDILKELDVQYDSVVQILLAQTANERRDELERCQQELDKHRKDIKMRHGDIENMVIQALSPEKLLQKNMRLEEKAVLLGALRNAHIPATTSTLFQLLRDTQLSPVIRILTIQALDTFKNNTHQILQQLELVQKNPYESATVRIQAFRSMVNLGMPTPTLVRIANSVANEKEKQVSTYIWSALTKLANSTFAPYLWAASQARAALPLLQPVESGMQDSQYRHYLMQLARNTSLLKESSYISDTKTVIVADYAAYLDMFGATNKALQVSFVSEGLPKLLTSMVGPEGFFTERNSVFDLFKGVQWERKGQSSNIMPMIQQIFRVLKVEKRSLPIPNAVVSVQVMNQVIKAVNITQFLHDLTYLKKISEHIEYMHEDREEKLPLQRKLARGMNLAYRMSGIASQFFQELPTEAGFPVKLQLGLSYTANITGQVSAEVDRKSDRKSTGRLSVRPQIVGTVMGKMSVDGFLMQTGALFEATGTLDSPMTINTTLDTKKQLFSLEIAPPASSSPVVKMAVKPYVFSEAVSHTVPKRDPQQIDVNRRPIFRTMQPVIISQGAKIKHVKTSFGQQTLGYKVEWQAQYLWQSLTSALAPPMLGRSHYALYVKAADSPAPAIKLNVKYLSEPKHLSRKRNEQNVGRSSLESQDMDQDQDQGSCDNWHMPFCCSTDPCDPTSIQQLLRDGFPVPPLPDLPNVHGSDRNVSLQALKTKMQDDMQVMMTPAPSEWGVVAVMDSSSQEVRRAMSITALFQSWQNGHFQQAYLTLFRTPIPGYDQKAWKMLLQSRTTFPRQRLTVKDLLNPTYQKESNCDALSMSQRTLANLFFQEQLDSSVNNYAMQRLPSLEPEVILDNVGPEFVLVNNRSKVITAVRTVLKTLLPLSQQLKELKAELKDGFKTQTRLLWDLSLKTLAQQSRIKRILAWIKKLPFKPPKFVTTSVEYAVLKVTQATLDFNAVVENTGLMQQTQWWKQVRKVNRNQYMVQAFSHEALSEDRHQFSSLLNHQLQVIKDVWNKVRKQEPMSSQDIRDLVSNTTRNMTVLNEVLKKVQEKNNVTLAQQCLQSAQQQQILVHTLSQFRFGVAQDVSDLLQYAMKVQTREMLERGSLLLQQIKKDKVCTDILESREQAAMRKLHHIDRMLMSTQHEYVTLPNRHHPWTTNSTQLQQAWETLQDCVTQLKAVRERLDRLPKQAPPCLLTKLVDSATALQQKVSIFKRMILAQDSVPRLTARYQELDDQTMNLIISMSRLFRKDVDPELQWPDNIRYPHITYVIDKVVLKLSAMSVGLDMVLQRLDDLYQGVINPGNPAEERYLNEIFDNCTKAQDNLSGMREWLKTAIMEEKPHYQNSALSSFVDTYQKFHSVYSMLVAMHQERPQSQDDQQRIPKINRKIEELNRMLEEIQAFEVQAITKATIIPPVTSSESEQEYVGIRYPYGGDEGAYSRNKHIGSSSSSSSSSSSGGKSSSRSSSSSFSSSSSSEEIDQMGAIALMSTPPVEGISVVANVSFPYSSDNNMAIQILARKSLSQRLWEQAQFFPESRDSCVSMAVKGELVGKSDLNKCILDTMTRLNTYNHVHLAVQAAKKMPDILSSGMDQLMWRLMADYYDRSTVMEPQPMVNSKSLHAVLDFSQPIRAVDAFFLTPETSLVLESVPLPFMVDSIFPFQNLDLQSKVSALKMSKRMKPGTCIINGGVVRTNDGAEFLLPESRVKTLCRSVLAMDCSPDPSFAITANMSADARRDKAQIVDIMAENHVVQLIPDYLKDKVKVDGMLHDIKFGQSLVRHKNFGGGSKGISMVVSLVSPEGPIHVQYPLLGLDVYFSYSYISMEMSAVFQYQLCGLCGNYDGQVTRELEGPEGSTQIFSSAWDLYYSYLVMDPLCRAQIDLQQSKGRPKKGVQQRGRMALKHGRMHKPRRHGDKH